MQAKPASVDGKGASIASRLLGSLLILVVVLNVLNATGRYLLSWSPTGTDEALVYLMILVTMGGAMLALARREHIRIDLLQMAVGPGIRAALELFYNLVGFATISFTAWASLGFVLRLARLDTRSMTLGVPMFWPHSVVLAGLIGMGLLCGYRLVRQIRDVWAGASRSLTGGSA